MVWNSLQGAQRSTVHFHVLQQQQEKTHNIRISSEFRVCVICTTPSQAEMRYVSAKFSDVRSKSVNKVWQLQCTGHLDFPPEYTTAKIIIR